MSAPVFRLKGSGWYETDFKSDKEGQRNLAGERACGSEVRDGGRQGGRRRQERRQTRSGRCRGRQGEAGVAAPRRAEAKKAPARRRLQARRTSAKRADKRPVRKRGASARARR